MSRYIDLDGVTWDGTPIKTKVMEMETNHGYLQAIGAGWLWGDTVPHIDLQEHDAKVKQQAIDEFVKKICKKYTEEERKGNYKQYCGEIKQNIADIAEQLKGE